MLSLSSPSCPARGRRHDGHGHHHHHDHDDDKDDDDDTDVDIDDHDDVNDDDHLRRHHPVHCQPAIQARHRARRPVGSAGERDYPSKIRIFSGPCMALTTEYTLTERQNAMPARSPDALHLS